ncbi:MAG: hypothetical protein ACXVCY_05975 [Pseudobdellovibrionaceae bacterium]
MEVLSVFLAKTVVNFKNVLSLRRLKNVHFIGICLSGIALVAFFQNCQRSANHFSAMNSLQTSLASSNDLEINLKSELANLNDCNDGLKVEILINSSSLAEASYSFDGGNTWDAQPFKIFKEPSILAIGEVIVKNKDGVLGSNKSSYNVVLDQCSLSANTNTQPNIGHRGAWSSSISCDGATQVTSYFCPGGNGQCAGNQPPSLSVPNSSACGYVAPSPAQGGQTSTTTQNDCAAVYPGSGIWTCQYCSSYCDFNDCTKFNRGSFKACVRKLNDITGDTTIQAAPAQGQVGIIIYNWSSQGVGANCSPSSDCSWQTPTN